MYDSKLADTIVKILEDGKGKEFKSGDIARIIKLKKHKRRDLEDTLRKLKRNRKIQGKNKRYFATSSPSKSYTGRFDARPLAKNLSFAFVIQEDKDIYVAREDILNAYHGDLVTVELKYSGKDYLHGYITSIVERANRKIVGVLKKSQGKYYLVADVSLLHTDFIAADADDSMLGKKIAGEVTNWGNPEEYKLPVCKIVEVLGKAGEPDVEIMSVICQYNLPLEFPESVLAELKTLPEITGQDYEDRLDLRNVFTLTIDPASAKDFDDAISLQINDEGFLLYVHIADVAHYVQPGTALFAEAVKRGNSFYFPRKVIPMLPEKISNQTCSLRPGEEKLTVSVITQYDKEGWIIKQYSSESIIESNIRLAYEEVDAFFDNKSTIDDDTAAALVKMRQLSRILQENRVDRGYLSLDLPETEYVFDDEGHVIDLIRSVETESHQMIENFMLVANEYIARQLSSFPTMYRIHEAPDADSIEDMRRLANVHNFHFELKTTLNKAFQQALLSLETAERHRVFDHLILRHLSKARYDTLNAGHFGLAMEYYTHFTSPIRRLCDLIIHHQIKAKIKQEVENKKLVFSPVKLKEFAKTATEQEMLADTTEREVDRKNKLLFMKKHIGEEFTGVITGIKSNRIIVELDRYPVNGVIPLSTIKDDYYEYREYYEMLLGSRSAKTFKLADKVKVSVVKVDDDVFLQLLEH